MLNPKPQILPSPKQTLRLIWPLLPRTIVFAGPLRGFYRSLGMRTPVVSISMTRTLNPRLFLHIFLAIQWRRTIIHETLRVPVPETSVRGVRATEIVRLFYVLRYIGMHSNRALGIGGIVVAIVVHFLGGKQVNF